MNERQGANRALDLAAPGSGYGARAAQLDEGNRVWSDITDLMRQRNALSRGDASPGPDYGARAAQLAEGNKVWGDITGLLRERNVADGMALPSATPTEPAGPVSRLAAIGARGPAIGRPPLGATRPAGASSQLGDLVNQIYGTPMGKAVAGAPASTVSVPQEGAPSEGVLADPNFKAMAGAARRPTLEEMRSGNIAGATPEDYEKLQQAGGVRPSPLQQAIMSGGTTPNGFVGPRNVDDASRATFHSADMYNRRLAKEIFGTDEPTYKQLNAAMEIGMDRQAAQSVTDYQREKAERMRNATDPIQLARDLGGFGYTRSPARQEIADAVKLMEDRAERASKERVAAELQGGRGHRLRSNVQAIRETLRRQYPGWTEEQLNTEATQRAQQNVDIEDAVTDRSVPAQPAAAPPAIQPAVGIKPASNAPAQPTGITPTVGNAPPGPPKAKTKLDKYLESILPTTQERILGPAGSAVNIPAALREIASLGVTQPQHFEDLYQEMGKRYGTGGQPKALAELQNYLLRRALPLGIQSIGDINILRNQGPQGGASIETPRGGLYHRTAPGIAYSENPVYSKNKEQALADLQAIAKLLGSRTAGITYAPPPPRVGLRGPGFE